MKSGWGPMDLGGTDKVPWVYKAKRLMIRLASPMGEQSATFSSTLENIKKTERID
jgi:hypothetical protein